MHVKPIARFSRSRWLSLLLVGVTVSVLNACTGTAGYQASDRGASAAGGFDKAVLYDQYQQWRGTLYQYGGLSKSGVDCSGFVYLTFRHRFGLDIPRTTLHQSRLGNAVSSERLQTGDLVFFDTGDDKRHVGIYLENRQFLHASTSRGVTISSLRNRYWKRRYRHARRLDI